MTRDVPCETAERWLSRAIDEEISAEEEVLLERHLDTCPHCRTERERLFLEVQRLESGFAGISAELDDLLRGKLGADRIAESAPREKAPSSGSLLSTAIAALAAVIVAGLLYFDRSPPAAAGPSATAEWDEAGLVRVEGRRTGLLAGPGTGLFPAGSRLRVPAGGDLRLALPSGDRARVGAEGDLELRAIDGAVELELHSGRAAFGVEPRSASSFVVLTPVARIAVTGTRFGVIHEGGSTEVTVEEGIVEVTPRAREAKPRRLGPGGWVSISEKWIRHDTGGWQEPPPAPVGPAAGNAPAEPPAPPKEPVPPPQEGEPKPKPKPKPGPLDVPPGGGGG